MSIISSMFYSKMESIISILVSFISNFTNKCKSFSIFDFLSIKDKSQNANKLEDGYESDLEKGILFSNSTVYNDFTSTDKNVNPCAVSEFDFDYSAPTQINWDAQNPIYNIRLNPTVLDSSHPQNNINVIKNDTINNTVRVDTSTNTTDVDIPTNQAAVRNIHNDNSDNMVSSDIFPRNNTSETYAPAVPAVLNAESLLWQFNQAFQNQLRNNNHNSFNSNNNLSINHSDNNIHNSSAVTGNHFKMHTAALSDDEDVEELSDDDYEDYTIPLVQSTNHQENSLIINSNYSLPSLETKFEPISISKLETVIEHEHDDRNAADFDSAYYSDLEYPVFNQNEIPLDDELLFTLYKRNETAVQMIDRNVGLQTKSEVYNDARTSTSSEKNLKREFVDNEIDDEDRDLDESDDVNLNMNMNKIRKTNSTLSNTPMKSLPNSTDDEKSYVCEVCNLSFKVKGYLTRHSKKHFTSKPFKCPYFDSSLGLEDNENNSEQSESQTTQNELDTSHRSGCHVTGGFSRRDTLNTHLKARHFIYPSGTKLADRDKKSGRCAACFQEFATNKDWLKNHVTPRKCTGCVTQYE